MITAYVERVGTSTRAILADMPSADTSKNMSFSASGDVSVDDFVRRHADAVISTFNEAKNKHMYVLFCLLLKFEKFLSRSLSMYDRRLFSHTCLICLF